MKKISALITAALAACALSVSASAEISKLPIEPVSGEGSDIRVLAQSVSLNKDFTLEEDETLVIPSGRRIKVTGGKTLTLDGKVFIENGGSITVESGKLLMNEKSVLVSRGKVNVKPDGEAVVMPDASLIVAPDGAMKLEGGIMRDPSVSRAVCLGKYKGETEGIKADILAAVSFLEYDPYSCKYRDFRTYTAEEAAKLLPENISADGCQYAPLGARLFTEKFFLSNGQTLDISIYDDENGKNAWLNGLFIKLD